MVSKLLSMGILLGSFSLKLPQISTMVKGKTAAGVSYSSMLFETIALVMTAGYNFHFGFVLSSYAENVVILGQNWIILYLTFAYQQIALPQFLIAMTSTLALAFCYLANFVPEEIYFYNQVIVLAMSTPRVTSDPLQRPPDPPAAQDEGPRRLVSDHFPPRVRRLLRQDLHHAGRSARPAHPRTRRSHRRTSPWPPC